MVSECGKDNYYGGCNVGLLNAVPLQAIRVLEVGCGEGKLGEELKKLNPDRVVIGLERNSDASLIASKRLDQVHCIDIEQTDPPVDINSIDCIIFGDVLEHLVNPLNVLKKYHELLRCGGIILCSIPNVQHFSVIIEILSGDFQYRDKGLLDRTHIRFFTYASFVKLMLDAGYCPSVVDTNKKSMYIGLRSVFYPILEYIKVSPNRSFRFLESYQYIFKGTVIENVNTEEVPLTFVVCVSDDRSLNSNLLSSPCLQGDTPHEVLQFRNCRSAAEGLNRGIELAKNRTVICVHQDVYLPNDWPKRFMQQVKLAEDRYGEIGVVGLYGVTKCEDKRVSSGHVVDRTMLLSFTAMLPVLVDTIDEIVIAVNKDSGLRFDEKLGFHLYGADICLSAQAKGLASVVVDSICFHNSQTAGIPDAFYDSAIVMMEKWKHKTPLATSIALLNDNFIKKRNGALKKIFSLNNSIKKMETIFRKIRTYRDMKSFGDL